MLYTPVSEAHQSVAVSPPTAASNAPLHCCRHKTVSCDCHRLRASFGGLEPNVCGQREIPFK